jgi:putative transcription factor
MNRALDSFSPLNEKIRYISREPSLLQQTFPTHFALTTKHLHPRLPKHRKTSIQPNLRTRLSEMSEDWNSVTKIGSKVRGPGTAQRETTVKGKSALNAAQRSGAIVATEKKFSSANAGSNPEGQRLTKVDRADGPVATKKVSEEVAKALSQARNNLKNQKGNTMTQKDLANKANVDVKYVADLERAGAEYPPQDVVTKLQKAANVKLTGTNIGDPMLGPKKK